MVAKKLTNYSLNQALRDIANIRNYLGTPLLNPLYFADQTGVPAAPGAGGGIYSVNGGFLQIITSGDGQSYDIGRQTQWNANPVPITSTTPITVFTFNNVQTNITYRISGQLSCTNGSSGTLQPQTMRVGGSATWTGIRLNVRTQQEAANTSSPAIAYGQIASPGTDISFSRTPALSEIFVMEFDGIGTCSAAGTFIIQGRCVTSSSDVTFSVNAYSYTDIEPVNATA